MKNRAAATPEVDVPFTRHVLPNGLTLLVHEDRKAPVVAVNVWYHVGSKNERPGRTGFAHLFEHLMFNGSRHFNDDWFRAVERLGATGVNGTTSNDRTNYFQTVPKGALDPILWLESDRMAHLLGGVDQGKLDEQRGVVQNEKRQGENAPYGRVREILPSFTHPAGHPYSWSVIGSMEDLNAASLDDVREWFLTWYGAANAVIAVAGDVDTADAVRRVERFFGEVPPGPPLQRPGVRIHRPTGVARLSMEDRVPQAMHLRLWNTPPWGTRDGHLLELAAAVLGRGEGSRLHDRLVRREGLATEVQAFQHALEIEGQFILHALAVPGADARRMEAVLEEELARFLASGPTEEELAIEVVHTRASFLRGIERVGGFGGKTDLLVEGQVFGGRPDAWKDWLRVVAEATPDAVREAAARWLTDGAHVVDVLPYAARTAAAKPADRAAVPGAEDPAEARFPAIRRAALPNGMKVVLAPRPALPLVWMELLVDAGFAADPAGAPGTASLVGSLLPSGTTTRTALQILREADRLGARLDVSTGVDTSRVTLSALRAELEPSVALLADVALRPSFPPGEVELQRRRQLAAIDQERMDAQSMPMRLLPRLLYGQGHPYAVPFSGTGTTGSVAALAREDLARFHGSWFRPSNATVVVSGDATLEEILPLLERHFGAWEEGRPSRKEPPAPGAPPRARLHLLDRPGAPQTVLAAAQLVPARGTPEEVPLTVLNTILGGKFTSRLNMNLREDKHWSYGAGSYVRDTRGPRPFLAFASVQTDRTAESLVEILKEIRGIAGEVPATEEEASVAKGTLTLTLSGRWETAAAVAQSLAELVAFRLPDDYFDGYASRIRAVTAADLAAAGRVLRPEGLVWAAIGDRAKIEQGLRALGTVEVVVVDPEGSPAA